LQTQVVEELRAAGEKYEKEAHLFDGGNVGNKGG